MKNMIALLAGLVFGLGLTISGMIDTQKVINFLDLTGQWDPSLAFVMAAALAITLPGFHFLLKRQQPFYESHFSLPSIKQIDKQLIIGASLFGIGWGLYGYCPGPAIAMLGTVDSKNIAFVIAMITGMFVASRVKL